MIDMKCLNKSAESFDPSCKICFDANFNTVFLPCGHLLCCEDCAKTIRTCPMCRSTVDSAKKVFLQWMKFKCTAYIIHVNSWLYNYKQCIGFTRELLFIYSERVNWQKFLFTKEEISEIFMSWLSPANLLLFKHICCADVSRILFMTLCSDKIKLKTIKYNLT